MGPHTLPKSGSHIRIFICISSLIVLFAHCVIFPNTTSNSSGFRIISCSPPGWYKLRSNCKKQHTKNKNQMENCPSEYREWMLCVHRRRRLVLFSKGSPFPSSSSDSTLCATCYIHLHSFLFVITISTKYLPHLCTYLIPPISSFHTAKDKPGSKNVEKTKYQLKSFDNISWIPILESTISEGAAAMELRVRIRKLLN